MFFLFKSNRLSLLANAMPNEQKGEEDGHVRNKIRMDQSHENHG